jgi:hypothetical protein
LGFKQGIYYLEGSADVHERRVRVAGPKEALVKGLGFWVQGSGFRVQGSGFRVRGSGFRIRGLRFRVWGSGFRTQGFGVQGVKCKASGMRELI